LFLSSDLRDATIGAARRVVRERTIDRPRYDCAARAAFRRASCMRTQLCHTM